MSQIELRPDLPTFTAEGRNLSSHPSLHPEKMELSARPDEDALKAFLAEQVGGEKMGGLLGGLLGGKEEGDKKKGLLDGLLGGKKESDESEDAKAKEGEKKKGLLDGLLGK